MTELVATEESEEIPPDVPVEVPVEVVEAAEVIEVVEVGMGFSVKSTSGLGVPPMTYESPRNIYMCIYIYIIDIYIYIYYFISTVMVTTVVPTVA